MIKQLLDSAFSGALTHVNSAQQSAMGKKIWLSMHPRIFGSNQIIHKYVYAYVTPSHKTRVKFRISRTRTFLR